jgi:hypothetical protein
MLYVIDVDNHNIETASPGVRLSISISQNSVVAWRMRNNRSAMLSDPTQSSPVNLYIALLWVLFVGHRTIEAKSHIHTL